MERDAAAGRGDDLRDAAAHLARADDEDVLELHGASLGVRRASRAGARPAGRVARPCGAAGSPRAARARERRCRSPTLIGPPRGSPPAATRRPGSTTLHAVASHVCAGPRVSRRPTVLSSGNVDVAVGPGRAPHLEHARRSPFTCCSTSTVRIDLRRTSELALPLGDDARRRPPRPSRRAARRAACRCTCTRLPGSRARARRAGIRSRALQTSISSASP